MNKIFFDFEFIEDGSAFVMEPISLGLIRYQGPDVPVDSLYIEFDGVDWSKANNWVLENVKPNLYLPIPHTKEQARFDIKNFCGEKPEFWAYFADYDWVLLCQLFGRMLDLPEGWPMWCRDLKQLMWQLGLDKDDIPILNEGAHNALSDAKWNLKVYKWILKNRNPNKVDFINV